MQYETVIGLETHAELLTETKLFCGCLNRFGAPPNTLVCPVCLGLPGVLPVMNKKGFEMALKATLALHCRVNQFTTFDRKNYYYPDLPKNYQISQNYLNLGVDGCLEIKYDDQKRSIRIHNVHLEEEAGKLIHPEEPGADYSLVDFNRAGVPLLEIVTYPDMRSLEETEAYMNTLRNVLLYTEVSDCKMQEGSLRFEASISLRPTGQEKLGNRVEIKNLNSMKAVLKALEYETGRQMGVLEGGGVVALETRLWDELRERTERMRTKEEAHDYRYFPEPDLAPVVIKDQWLEELRATLPELPLARRNRFVTELGLSDYDAGVLTEDKAVADYFERCVAHYESPKVVCNWVTNDVLRELKERRLEIKDFPVGPEMLVELVKLVETGTVSMPVARGVFVEMVDTKKKAPQIIHERGLLQISDRAELEGIIQTILTENPNALTDYKKGKKTAITFLVGQIMRKTKGKANPQMVNELLKQKLEAS
ncbi:MAG TPA: Asp-tRNA(Asn)/Glu-tRNA(Gln) amidotransferase subunit GatB [Candidatus Brocadiales bacterium]|nr:Asp-tRNA(Asn)/Glu-tRNA(Gln) amidotransferase subunit GatB [Candidatus Brocadiales bacterium]